MIAKLVKGRGFRGAAEYDLNKEKGRIISTNMACLLYTSDAADE